MAKGRMLNTSISEDVAVNNLPDDTCRLLFTWIIPHLCREGRFWGEPRMILTKVMPWRSDLTEQRIDDYLNAMRDQELIVRYTVKGLRYIYFPNFDKNQPGLRKDREGPSPFPAAPDTYSGETPERLRSDDGGTQEEGPLNNNLTGTEVNELLSLSDTPPAEAEPPAGMIARVDGKGLRPTMNCDADLGRASRLYEKDFGALTPTIGDTLWDMVQTYTGDWLIDAMQVSVRAEKRFLSHTEGVLKNWKTNGKGARPPQAARSNANGHSAKPLNGLAGAPANKAATDEDRRPRDQPARGAGSSGV